MSELVCRKKTNDKEGKKKFPIKKIPRLSDRSPQPMIWRQQSASVCLGLRVGDEGLNSNTKKLNRFKKILNRCWKGSEWYEWGSIWVQARGMDAFRGWCGRADGRAGARTLGTQHATPGERGGAGGRYPKHARLGVGSSAENGARTLDRQRDTRRRRPAQSRK